MDIDWKRGYTMLDKELQQIIRAAKHGRRYVDKLAKVWLKNGEERWLLIHIEVQAKKDVHFPKRMYIYNYRVFDRYDREVISLAILADDDPIWRPSQYSYGRWGFRSGIEFPVAKVLDFLPRIDTLETSPNPFALLVVAHLKSILTREGPTERKVWKVRLVKQLIDRGFRADDVRDLFRFIDWIMALPDTEEQLFQEEIALYQEQKRMPFIDVFTRKGMEKGLIAGIEAMLETRFGENGLKLMPEIRQIQDHEILRDILQETKTASTPDQVRRLWAGKRRSKKQRRN